MKLFTLKLRLVSTQASVTQNGVTVAVRVTLPHSINF